MTDAGLKHGGIGHHPAGDEAPVVRDQQLLDQFYRVPLDQPIGPELFTVMASLLAHVLQVGRRDTP